MCAVFLFSQRDRELSLLSLSHAAETHEIQLFLFLLAPAYCTIALTLDFCQSLSIREKWQIHMSWQTGGEGKGVLFSERGRMLRCFKSQRVSESLSDSWMPACCSSSHDTVFAAGVVFVWVLLLEPELLVCHFMRSFSVFGKLRLGYTKLKGV